MTRIPVVNENDEIIGSEERLVVHRDGLRHREVHVWLITSNNKIIFQKRGMDKDTYPGLLDATAGGHVDLESEDYERAAERELFEETGLKDQKIIFVEKIRVESFDPITRNYNNPFRSIFVSRYNGDIN